MAKMKGIGGQNWKFHEMSKANMTLFSLKKLSRDLGQFCF